MKLLGFTIACGLVLLVVSCERNPEVAAPGPDNPQSGVPAPASTEIPPAIERAVREKGDAIAKTAFGVLSSRLGKAIADAGHTNAVTFCSVHGLTLTSSVGLTNRVVLRRVTHRARNTLNRADTNELALIRQLEDGIRRGASPEPVVRANTPDSITYYAPIVLQLPLCLTCHGDPSKDIQPDVLTHIRKTYPADEATGFALGELRGLWSVEFQRSDFAPPP